MKNITSSQKADVQKSRGGSSILWVVTVVALLAIGGAVYLYKQVRELKKNNQFEDLQSNQDQLKEKISKLINLPDEKPTVANVTDKEKLKDQPFFKDAQNGDSLLIFPAAKKAIIYRESENRLINVGPIAITSDKEAMKESEEEETESENSRGRINLESDEAEKETTERSSERLAGESGGLDDESGDESTEEDERE